MKLCARYLIALLLLVTMSTPPVIGSVAHGRSGKWSDQPAPENKPPVPTRPAGDSDHSIYDSLKLDPVTLPEGLRVTTGSPLGDPGPKQVVARGVRRALLVGVGQAVYDGIKQNPLPQCVIDASTLAATLKPRGYQCQLLSDNELSQPSTANIRQEVSAITAACGPDDQLLIYISTHGDVIKGESVIIASDGAVPIDWIKSQAAGSKALVKIIMLDCCRNDKGFGRKSNEFRDVYTISACRPDELSQVGQSGMSIFTEALVDALVECRADRIKDGQIELDELMFFLDKEVPIRSAKLGANKTQNPTRTVVDPKAINPIFASCTFHDTLTLGPTAFAGTPVPAARNDMVLTELVSGSLKLGMTPAEAEKALGYPFTSPPDLDDKGDGLGVLSDKPRQGDAIVVRFAARKIAAVHVLFGNNCKQKYNSTAIRGALLKVLGDRPLSELEAELKGLSPKQVQEKIGCAAAALLPTGSFKAESGELRYPQVPRPGQMLVILIKDGVYSGVTIVPLDE